MDELHQIQDAHATWTFGKEAFFFHCGRQQMVSADPPPEKATSWSCWAAAWQTAGRSLDGCSSAGAAGPAVTSSVKPSP